MPMTTRKCYVMRGSGKVGLMEKPIPRRGSNDAIIRAAAALICTSETHTVAGAIGDRRAPSKIGICGEAPSNYPDFAAWLAGMASTRCHTTPMLSPAWRGRRPAAQLRALADVPPVNKSDRGPFRDSIARDDRHNLL